MTTKTNIEAVAMSDEHAAFEAWYSRYHEKACAEFGGIDCTNPKGIAEDAWQARAASPQATATQPVQTERALTDEQWYDLAQRHANADWNSDGYLSAIKAVCADFMLTAAQPASSLAEGDKQ